MTYTCRRCGQHVPTEHAVCTHCGAVAHRPGDVIRCQHCHRRASSALTLCPHCGRKLAPWRPDRTLAGAGLGLLLLLWLLIGGGGAALGKAAQGLVALLPPPATLVPAPVNEAPIMPSPTAATIVQATVTPRPPTPIPTLILIFTSTPTPGPTATATATPAATATAISEQTYTVQPGDTPIGIAARFDISVADLLAYNNISDPTSLRVNQELRIPPAATVTAAPAATATATTTAPPSSAATATPTPTPTSTPPPTPTSGGPVVYVVQPGDTPIGIASQFNVTVAGLLAYNNISDPTSLRVNQELRIPPAGYTPPTPTPRRPTATPTPAATPTPSIAIPVPVLISPGNNAPFKGIENIVVLQWQNPGGLPAGVENVLYIGVLVGADAIDWRFNDPLGAATEFRVPEWLFGQAPQEFGRTYIWYVQAASISRQDGQVTAISPVSPPSAQFRFQWN